MELLFWKELLFWSQRERDNKQMSIYYYVSVMEKNKTRLGVQDDPERKVLLRMNRDAFLGDTK